MIGNSETKTIDVTLIHTWQQEINKSQFKLKSTIVYKESLLMNSVIPLSPLNPVYNLVLLSKDTHLLFFDSCSYHRHVIDGILRLIY